MLCSTEHALEEEKRNAVRAVRLGLKTEVVGPADLARLEPGIRIQSLGGVHYLDDAHMIPWEFMALLARLLAEQKVECHWSTQVTGWKTDGKTIDAVRTTAGVLSGDEYVITGGSWSPVVARPLGLRLPMQSGKGYSLTLPNPRHAATIPAIFVEAKLAVTPMGGAMRFGGTMEITGLDESINPPRVRGILKSVLKHYPDYRTEDFASVQPWCGLRPLSPDGMAFIGRFKQFSNLSVGTGHAMQGLSQGPITGKLLAEMLSDEPLTMDITPLSPERYS
jgi:D-amino-acid dehydrogenase